MNGFITQQQPSVSSPPAPPPPLGQILFDNPVVESGDDDDDDDNDDEDEDDVLNGGGGVNDSDYVTRRMVNGVLESDTVRVVREQEQASNCRLQDPIYFLTSTVSRNWEYSNVSLTRVPGYGFGIAVSGGCDNPHFANGDPAIAISDVLKGGPAQGKLQINDRIVSANGISLDNVDYSTAVQILRDSGPTVSLRVKRRVNPTTYKASLPIPTKRLKKLSYDSLGFTLSLTLQIKTVESETLGIREGDLIDKIQGYRVNELFNEKVIIKELRRVLEESSSNGSNTTNLNLTVKRSGGNNNNRSHQQAPTTSNQPTQNPAAQPPAIHHAQQSSIGNLYVQPPTRNPQNNKSFDSNVFPPPPPPPRPPLPSEFEEVPSPSQPTQQDSQQPLIRSINFIKQNQLGIRLSGGNKSGIIVSAVQKSSQADTQGLQVNDKIIRVNEHDFITTPPTREQAINILSSIPNDTLVNLTVTKTTGLSRSDHQDEFYIRTRVSTDEFKLHEVLMVTDTLVNGTVGCWEAYRVDVSTGSVVPGSKIIIPNSKNAIELLKKSWKRTTSFRSREFEDLLVASIAHSPYDIVSKIIVPLHLRPVIILSPLNSLIIQGLVGVKQSSRIVKVVSGNELEFNDGRVRVVSDLVSVKFIQEMYERGVHPFVVYVHFRGKEDLKEVCRGGNSGELGYSRVKKLWGVLGKVYEKLGGFVSLRVDVGGVGEAVERVYRVVCDNAGSVCFALEQHQSSPQQQQPTTPNPSSTTKRPKSAAAVAAASRSTPSNHTTPVRPTSSNNIQHYKHKSTDSLVSSSPRQQQSSPIKFPNFNIPPPCSIIEQNSVQQQQVSSSSPQQQDNNKTLEYEKRPTLQRSVTSVGSNNDRVNGLSSLHNNNSAHHHHHNIHHQVSNNFAHSPVLDRRGEYVSNQVQSPSNGKMNGGSSIPPPIVDRTKKPSSSLPYISSSSPSKPGSSNKPVPPPKPKILLQQPQTHGNHHHHSNHTTQLPSSRTHSRNDNLEDSSEGDTGQTYLNIPMNSKMLIQQQSSRNERGSNGITSGYFDWRGGRLVQKHVLGNQIPIELFVPERAIPVGESVNVWFQIVDYNVRDDPTSTKSLQRKMLSPLVKFGPENYRFQIPVEIRIPQYSSSTTSANINDNSNMLAQVLMNNQSDYWTKIDIQNGNCPGGESDVKIVSLTVQQF